MTLFRDAPDGLSNPVWCDGQGWYEGAFNYLQNPCTTGTELVPVAVTAESSMPVIFPEGNTGTLLLAGVAVIVFLLAVNKK